MPVAVVSSQINSLRKNQSRFPVLKLTKLDATRLSLGRTDVLGFSEKPGTSFIHRYGFS
jgi:hypothetical protein